jgi:hypothetical protein
MGWQKKQQRLNAKNLFSDFLNALSNTVYTKLSLLVLPHIQGAIYGSVENPNKFFSLKNMVYF